MWGYLFGLESTPQTALFGVKAPLRALIRAGHGSKLGSQRQRVMGLNAGLRLKRNNAEVTEEGGWDGP